MYLLDFPVETLEHIVHFLDVEPPSRSRIYGAPSERYFSSAEQPLKNLALCCRVLNRLVKPLLLQTLVFKVDHPVGDWIDVIKKYEIKPPIRSVLLYAPTLHASQDQGKARANKENQIADGVWIACTVILGLLSPQILTFALPQTMLSGLIGTDPDPRDVDLVEVPFQILQLQYHGNSKNMPVGYGHTTEESAQGPAEAAEAANHDSSDGAATPPGPQHETDNLSFGGDENINHPDDDAWTDGISEEEEDTGGIFYLRPWTHLTFNAGSSMRAYDEVFHGSSDELDGEAFCQPS